MANLECRSEPNGLVFELQLQALILSLAHSHNRRLDLTRPSLNGTDPPNVLRGCA
jgi:hypothetical protein